LSRIARRHGGGSGSARRREAGDGDTGRERSETPRGAAAQFEDRYRRYRERARMLVPRFGPDPDSIKDADSTRRQGAAVNRHVDESSR